MSESVLNLVGVRNCLLHEVFEALGPLVLMVILSVSICIFICVIVLYFQSSAEGEVFYGNHRYEGFCVDLLEQVIL